MAVVKDFAFTMTLDESCNRPWQHYLYVYSNGVYDLKIIKTENSREHKFVVEQYHNIGHHIMNDIYPDYHKLKGDEMHCLELKTTKEEIMDRKPGAAPPMKTTSKKDSATPPIPMNVLKRKQDSLEK